MRPAGRCRWLRGALAGLALVSAGCADPCAGVVACEGVAVASFNGRVVGFPSAAGVGGVMVTVTVGDSTGVSVTDGDGFWTVRVAQPARVGSVVGSVTVAAPGVAAPYTVDGVTAPVSRRRGDGVDVGRWYAVPQLRFLGEVRPRGGVIVNGTTVRVERVGGVPAALDAVEVPIGGDRRFLVEAAAGDVGTLLVRLTFRVPGVTRPFVQDSLPVLTMYRDTAAQVQGLYSVGAGFPYRLRVLRRGSDQAVAGATVVFRRTGGVATALESVRVTTDVEGYASIDVQPTAAGTVEATATISGPGIPAETYAGLQYETVDDDRARFAGNFSVGAQVAGAIDVYRRGPIRRLAGTSWTFTPRSGPLTTPLQGVADARGAIFVRVPITSTATAVVGDLAVVWAPGLPPDTLRITVPIVRDDSIRFLGFQGVGPSLHYGGALQDIDGFAAIAGAGVEFRRTAGVPVEDSVYRTTTNEIGVFTLSSPPLADGEVVGDLTFRLPPPYRDTTFPGIRLATFRTDEFRLGPLIRVRKP